MIQAQLGGSVETGFEPVQADRRGANLGTRSWPPAAGRQGGGSVAGSLLYDEATHAVLHETGHPAPWNPVQRAGVATYQDMVEAAQQNLLSQVVGRVAALCHAKVGRAAGG